LLEIQLDPTTSDHPLIKQLMQELKILDRKTILGIFLKIRIKILGVEIRAVKRSCCLN
jgi:hypothetical protein